ncbi:MAG: hypothetical protein U9N39_08985 [Campylobacterota bacterium]|nr:hypothetical protein [Campylobacterota bacterium]
MLFFGHRFLENEKLYHVNDIESISKTPSNSNIYLGFHEKNLDIIEHLNENGVSFTLSVANVTELAYASALNAKYIVVNPALAKTAQSIAESYLFDAKILVNIESEDEIEEMLLLNVDGVLFSNAVVKINS